MTLEQVLKARGYTDQELADLGPALSNPKFRQSLEAELADLNTKVTSQNDIIAKTGEWYNNTALPTIEKTQADLISERAERARLQKALEEVQSRGMFDLAKAGINLNPVKEEKVVDPNAFDPNKYVTTDTLKSMASGVGESVTELHDLTEEYRTLFPGKPVPKMTELRREAQSRGLSLTQHMEAKFNLSARRQELEQESIKRREEEIRLDERRKIMESQSNPNLRSMGPSTSSIIAKKMEGGKQPWEMTKEERSAARVRESVQKVLQQQVH